MIGHCSSEPLPHLAQSFRHRRSNVSEKLQMMNICDDGESIVFVVVCDVYFN